MSHWTSSLPVAVLLPFLMCSCGGNLESQARKGIDHLHQDEPEKAVSRLQKALKSQDPELPRPLLTQAGSLAQYRVAPDATETEDALRQAVDAAPNAYEPLVNLGVWLLDHDQTAEGLNLLQKAIANEPSRTEALEFLAQAYRKQSETDKALSLLKQARDLKPSARILNALAVTQPPSSDTQVPRNLLQQAASLEPEFAAAHLNLAVILDQNRLDPEQAITHYENYLRLVPDAPETARIRQRIQIMGARLESGRFAQPDPIRVEVESLLAAAKTASRTGDESLALRNCLNANLKAGRADRSDLKERALRAATTLAPDHPRGHFGLGRFLEEQGRHSDALASLQKAQELQPAWPPALQATVELALRLEQPQVARKALDRTEQDPNTSPTLMLQVGELYEQVLNDRTAARRVYESWTRRFPQDARLPEVEARL